MNETWKDVVGYEGIYQVSDLGRVRRVRGGKGTTPGKLLKSRVKGTVAKYPAIMLYKGSIESRKTFFVHVLVAEAFLGPKPHGHEVNHRDGDKANPCLNNLEYVTKSGNRIHAMNVLGVGPDNTGSQNGQAVLTEDEVLRIRELYATGRYYLRELAVQFGVAQTVITNIINHRTWKHVGGPKSPITYRPLKATRPGNARLNPDKVRQIRSLSAINRYSSRQLAQMLGVSKTTIRDVLSGRTWSDVL